MNIIIFGPPGAGKGTQSEFIVKKYKLFKLSTGDLLREEINKNTSIGIKIASIVNSGSLVSNGLDFDGSNDHMPIPSSIISNINSFSGFIVCKGRSGFAIDTALAISKGSGTIVRLGNYLFGSATNSYASSTTTLAGTADDAKHLISLVVGDSNAESFLDGTSKGTISTASGYVADGNIGADVGSGNYWQGQIEEIIIYDSDQGSNRVVLETNIISHYGIS